MTSRWPIVVAAACAICLWSLPVGAASSDIVERLGSSVDAVPSSPSLAPAASEEFAAVAHTDTMMLPESSALRFHGYADFSYAVPIFERNSFGTIYTDTHGDFRIGNLNLYVEGAPDERWRTLVEVRFSYLPDGTANDADLVVTRTSTNVNDYNDFYRGTRWGSIVIERALVEYRWSSYLSVQGGQFLTPFGIWNMDHGTPTLISTERPYVVADSLAPLRQTGLLAHGRLMLEDGFVGYYATLSNGRGSFATFDDHDARFGYGGRAILHLTLLGDLTIGGSFYAGRDTVRQADIGVDAAGHFDNSSTLLEQYDESTWGLDLRWEYRNLTVMVEALRQDILYTERGRSLTTSLADSKYARRPDTARFGGYVLVGYRLPWFGVMPYAIWQTRTSYIDYFSRRADSWTAGFNVRLVPAVVFKLQYVRGIWLHYNPGFPKGGDLSGVTTQIAWAF